MILLADAWFLFMRAVGIRAPGNQISANPRDEEILLRILAEGTIPVTCEVRGHHHPLPEYAWRKGYRLSFQDSTMYPTGSVPGAKVLKGVRVCKLRFLHRISVLVSPPAPHTEHAVQKKQRTPRTSTQRDRAEQTIAKIYPKGRVPAPLSNKALASQVAAAMGDNPASKDTILRAAGRRK